MATKRGEKSKHEMVNMGLGYHKKADEFIERVVLPTDSLQGIALLYNTTVVELKKLNNLHKDTDLHARRLIKVPSKGILVDLTEAPAVPLLLPKTRNDTDTEEESTNGETYLTNVDNALQELREKAESVAAKSVVLQTQDVSLTRKDLLDMKSRNEDIVWWKIAIPCIIVLLIFPFIYYFYLEHLEYIHHHLQKLNITVISKPANATTSEAHYH